MIVELECKKRTYTVTHSRELEDLVIKWLPHIQVISPQRFKKHITKVLRVKMSALRE